MGANVLRPFWFTHMAHHLPPKVSKKFDYVEFFEFF